MWERYPEIADKLKRVDNIIQENLKSRNGPLEELLKNLAGGKRLRPAFVILSAAFGKQRDDKLLDSAAGIEILHMATLVHDDIIDDAGVRRGEITINKRHGDKMAVYIGDYLLTRAVMLLSRALPEDRLEQIARGVKSICEAEVEQFYSRFHPEVSLVTYLKRIARKTSAMFSFSCGEGVFLSKCPDKYKRNLVKFGFYYGMAFQIQDDILNLTEDMDKTGKPRGNDIQEGVITIPLILALRNNPDFAARIKTMLSGHKLEQKDVDWIIGEVIRLGGIREARDWMVRYLRKARKMLEPLPDKKEKAILLELTASMESAVESYFI